MTTLGPIGILGASFFSTHHASAADLLAGRERAPTQPTYDLLVGRARRFTSLLTQLHIEVCGPLTTDHKEDQLAVFATSHGEIQTAEAMFKGICQGIVSGARFALSVHNTASGLHSVATNNHAPTTTVTGKNAVAAGWLEAFLIALSTERTVLLSIADEPVPDLFKAEALKYGAAAAFMLGPKQQGVRQATLEIVPGSDKDIEAQPVLARAIDAWSSGSRDAIDLGPIQPGKRLALRFVERS